MMTGDDERSTMAPSPLPQHERSWRHPSELGQQRRASSRRSAPPLGPAVTFLVGFLGVGLIIGLVALVMPREAPREALPPVRNATVARATAQTVGASPAPGVAALDGQRFVLAVETAAGTRFVTTGDGRDVVIAIGDRLVRLDRVAVDSNLGISVLRAATTTNLAAKLNHAPDDSPEVGTSVVVRGSTDVSATIGISVATDTTSFVPLAGDVLVVNVAESSPVEDASGRLLGLFTTRAGAKGYVPFGAIDVLLSRSR